MRVLIGILYCGEREYEECRLAIGSQSFKDLSIFTVENEPAKLAHKMLYERFESERDHYDLFVKIDADMVLFDENRLRDLVSLVEKTVFNHYEIFVHDFFTGKLIPALHAYTSDFKFKLPEHEIIAFDHVHYHSHKLTLFSRKSPLVPFASHCPNPTAFQAFHYGAHRGIKYVEKGEFKYLRSILGCFSNYLTRSRDIRVFWAFLGGYLAIQMKLRADKVDYENPFLKDLFLQKRQNVMIIFLSILWYCNYRSKLMFHKAINNRFISKNHSLSKQFSSVYEPKTKTN